jgi:hypothetical protein
MQSRAVLVTILAIGCGKPDPAGPGDTDDTDVAGDADTDVDTGDEPDTDDHTDPDPDADADADGHTVAEGDCDDDDPLVFPGAEEICNGEDDDCDALIDGDDPDLGGATTTYTDADGDGFGDPATEATSCSGSGVEDGTDCDDTRADVHPGHPEICGDGAVNDCDGSYGDAVDACSGTIDLDAAEAEYQGVIFNDQAGKSVRNVGDVDGDGVIDLLIGAPHYSLSTGSGTPGRAFLVHGVASGIFDLASAHAILDGERDYDSCGWAVSTAGDVDGDGTPDLLVGAYANDAGTAPDGGAVYLIGGSVTGEVGLGSSDAILLGGDRGGSAGWGLDGGGDVDGDGSPDFAVGAFGAASGMGAVYVYTHAPTGSSYLGTSADVVLSGFMTTGYAGAAVAITGDATGDGIDDLIVGAYADSTVGTYSGATYLVHGSETLASASLSTADATLLGEAARDYAGYAVDFAGDFDGDGYEDLVIGGHAAGIYAGVAYVVSGTVTGSVSLNTALLKVTGEATYDTLGTSVSDAGDVDGDGAADIVIGAPQKDAGADASGAVYVVLGGTTGSTSVGAVGNRIDGKGKGDYLGAAVDSAGDIDGDGLGDLLLGASGRGSGLGSEGAVYVVLSPAI